MATTAGQRELTLGEAARYWLKLGFISFGGPAGQIAMMHTELVERRRWLSEQRFLHALNYTMVLPGPEAQQLATYMGWLMHGTFGGLIAGLLFVVPSLVLLVVLSWVYLVYGDVPAVAGLLYGIKPAVTAIVVLAAYRIGTRTLRNRALWLISLAAFLAIFLLQIAFPYIVLAAAVIGLLGAYIAPGYFSVSASAQQAEQQAEQSGGNYVIDDDTPAPPWAAFSWRRVIIICSAGLGLWAVLEGLLVYWFGWHGPLAQMGWFF
ncbi:MAG: chromate transporter, partial [Pseudomonadota bacterium]